MAVVRRAAPAHPRPTPDSGVYARVRLLDPFEPQILAREASARLGRPAAVVLGPRFGRGPRGALAPVDPLSAGLLDRALVKLLGHDLDLDTRVIAVPHALSAHLEGSRAWVFPLESPAWRMGALLIGGREPLAAGMLTDAIGLAADFALGLEEEDRRLRRAHFLCPA